MTHFSRLSALLLALFLTLLQLGAASLVHAQGDEPGSPLPPVPERSVPVLVGEFNAMLIIPAETSGLCPSSGRCLLGVGAGISALFERRVPRGLGIGIGYDLWLLDGNSIWQTPVAQSFTLGLRYWFMPESQLHPVVGISAGVMLLGETFEVATWGGLVDLKVGGEAELSTRVGFSFGMLARLYTLDSFVSEPDGTLRAGGFDVDLMVGLSVGLVVLEDTRRKD